MRETLGSRLFINRHRERSVAILWRRERRLVREGAAFAVAPFGLAVGGGITPRLDGHASLATTAFDAQKGAPCA